MSGRRTRSSVFYRRVMHEREGTEGAGSWLGAGRVVLGVGGGVLVIPRARRVFGNACLLLTLTAVYGMVGSLPLAFVLEFAGLDVPWAFVWAVFACGWVALLTACGILFAGEERGLYEWTGKGWEPVKSRGSP